MSAFTREIDRPLGQSGSRTGSRRRRVSRGALLSGVAVVVVALAAGAIAMREQPFRAVPEPVVEKPQVIAAAPAAPQPQAQAAELPAAPAAKPETGPKIIQVGPHDDAPPGAGVVVVRDAASLSQNLRVAHLPDKALIEDSDTGPLPIRAADGRRPMDVYARPWSGARGARVAIVIGGLGVSQTGTQAAIARLPGEVTLAFASNGNSIGRWMQEARRTGHEIIMQIPLEPFDYPSVDPGRNTLTVDASAEENLKNLHWAMSRTTNYTGVMNYMGARFSADAAAMQPVMADIGKRGLLYFDDGSTARSAAPEVALKNGVPFAAGDATIDADRDRGAILKKLDQLESTARAKGFAIGTGSAFDGTVDAVASWVAEARKRGIEIVPISAVVVDPERG